METDLLILTWAGVLMIGSLGILTGFISSLGTVIAPSRRFYLSLLVMAPVVIYFLLIVFMEMYMMDTHC